jgi:RHS repeat-associated protein
MASLTINGVLQAEYKYDFAGRQAVRKLPQLGVTLHSVFDAQGRRIAEYNEATGALVREYVWMGWNPIAVIEGGVVSLVRTDHIGRPVFATNAAGTKVWTASYLPFGGVRTTTGTPMTARFPGQWFQSESGLHQNWMRDYDPTTGRYLQADPLGLVAGASVYGYANQSPMMFMDPNGENPVMACLINQACRAAAGAVVAGSANLIYQLWNNNWELDCVDWWEVSDYAFYGAALAAPHYWWSSQARGGGIRAYQNGPGVDWHAFKYGGRWMNRPHYHIGRNASQMGKHRPWQGGWSIGGWRPW